MDGRRPLLPLGPLRGEGPEAEKAVWRASRSTRLCSLTFARTRVVEAWEMWTRRASFDSSALSPSD